MSEHFASVIWTIGNRIHAHLGKCILCGSEEGDTIVYARVHDHHGSLMLMPDGIGNRLCPACRKKHLPLDHKMQRRLDKLSDNVWPLVKKRGCPCCEAGLTWLSAPQVH